MAQKLDAETLAASGTAKVRALHVIETNCAKEILN